MTENRWRYEGSPEPVALAELTSRIWNGTIHPKTAVWEDGDGEPPRLLAEELLPICFTHPELYDLQSPRSLFQIRGELARGQLRPETLIAFAGGSQWLPLSTSNWAIPPAVLIANGLNSESRHSRSEPPASTDPFSEIDVFISYSHHDQKQAEHLHAGLAALGLRIWRDDRLADSPAHNFVTSIDEAHKRSRKVIVLWSRSSAVSNWVLSEAEEARKKEKIVGLLLEPFSALGEAIPIIFRNLPMQEMSAVAANSALLTRLLGAMEDAGRRGLFTLVEPEIDLSKLPDTYCTELVGRAAEMRLLVDAWDQGTTRITAFDAIGGAGKTALVYHFVEGLKTCGWRGARRVFAWSFYSQGSDEDRQVSADPFFLAAFRFFRDDPALQSSDLPKDGHQRGLDLARLIQAQRTLLILDGLEPLQYAAGKTGGGRSDKGIVGGIKDPGIKALLKQLAEKNSGLCIISTRIEIAELHGASGVRFEKLDRLPTEAGVKLLKDRGVEKGNQYRDDPLLQREFVSAVENLRGHALALTLASNYLVEFCHGKIRALADLPNLAQVDPSEPHRDPFRVMRAIEIALVRRIEEQGQTEHPASCAAGKQLALLFFLGFFDQPASTALLQVVFPQDRIPLPEILPEQEEEARIRMIRALFADLHNQGLSERALSSALGELARQGLVNKLNINRSWKDTEIDSHPLVREYFGQRLQELDLPSYQAGHGRLYEHFRYLGLPPEFTDPLAYAFLGFASAFPDLRDKLVRFANGEPPDPRIVDQASPILLRASPDTLRWAATLLDSEAWRRALPLFLPSTELRMSAIFAAVTHGCAAGRQSETFKEVFLPRVAGDDTGAHIHKLRTYGQSVAALATFFKHPWSQIEPTLTLSDQALGINMASVCLQTVGRVIDALEPMRLSVQQFARLGDWKSAAITTQNIARLLTCLGQLKGEQAHAESLSWAVEAGALGVDYAERSGDSDQRVANIAAHADAVLQTGDLATAEEILSHLDNFTAVVQGEDVFIARNRLAEIFGFYRAILDMASASEVIEDLRPLAFTAARIQALLQTSGSASGSPPVVDLSHLSDGIAALRSANDEVALTGGLLDAAEALYALGRFADIEAPLHEAEVMADRGPMPLSACDGALLRARMALATGDAERFGAHRNRAAELIARCGYGRRIPDLAVLDLEGAASRASADVAARVAQAEKAVGRGWWFLICRLEAVHRKSAGASWGRDLGTAIARLRAAEAAYRSAQIEVADSFEDVSDLWDALMADEDLRSSLEELLRAQGVDVSLDSLSPELKRALIEALRDSGLEL